MPSTYSIAKYGRPSSVAPASKNARDVWVREHRERLPLELEARDHVARLKPELDDLDRDAAPHRLVLLGEEHLAHRAFAQRVRATGKAPIVARHGER